jgi:8-oxo-dGTP pyrophosphatase MutT (NUDIX family)
MTPRNPWETLSQRIVYERAPFLRVREDEVIRPDGKPGTYSVTDSGNSNIVIPITVDNLFYIIGQWRYPVNHYSWEFPGGKTEGKESSIATAQRELLEETGFTANKIEIIGQLDLLSGMSKNSYDILLATGVNRKTNDLDKGDGIQQIKKVNMKELVAMIGKEITNAQSIAALMLYLSNPEVVRKHLRA